MVIPNRHRSEEAPVFRTTEDVASPAKPKHTKCPSNWRHLNLRFHPLHGLAHCNRREPRRRRLSSGLPLLGARAQAQLSQTVHRHARLAGQLGDVGIRIDNGPQELVVLAVEFRIGG